MPKEPHKRGPTTPRVVYLCPLDFGGLIGVRLRWEETRDTVAQLLLLWAVNRPVIMLVSLLFYILALPMGNQYSYHFWQTNTVWLLNPVQDGLSNM